MSQKTYMYDTQWTALINAIDGGDTSAIATALGQIKTSIDAIETTLGSLSTGVTQDSTQWTALVNAISSGGGGGGNVTIDSRQWTNLLNALNALTSYSSKVILGSDANGKPTSTSISVADLENLFTAPVSYQTGNFFDVEVWLSGGTKHIAFNGSAKQAISTGWQESSITLPAQYRPRSQVLRGVMVRQGANNIYATISIASTGVISINTTAALNSGTPLRFEFTYV